MKKEQIEKELENATVGTMQYESLLNALKELEND